jgi:AAA-like domain
VAWQGDPAGSRAAGDDRVKQPVSFIYRNVVFGDGPDDAWAAYRLFPQSYAGLTVSGKRELLHQLAALAYGLEADFSLLRVARPWDVEAYIEAARRATDARHVREWELDRYLERQRVALDGRASHTPEVYLSVRLPSSGAAGAVAIGQMPLLGALRRTFGLGDPRVIGRRRLEAVLTEEAKASQRVMDYVDAEPAATHELQWLIRRAFSRGLGDPLLDERFLPQALIVEPGGPDGSADGAHAHAYRPLEVDLLRLFDAPINIEPRLLRIEAEEGDSFQAILCFGALPDVVSFPGRRAELLFAPLESLDFPVDAAFSAQLLPNADAMRLVRRRIIDADNVYDEESHGEHGPSAATMDRPQLVRELEEYLTAGDHPPLLRSTISLAVGAPSREELEVRVERLRREYGALKLHRPLGDQLAMFASHLPGRPAAVPDYDDYLTVEQFGAMVPTATHAVGSELGPYIGHTLTGARQPVLFDATEASRTSRAPATLLSGTLGSGKTLCMQLIMYQAFLAGSTVCDIDPKGDHALELLPGVAEQMEIIELSPHERYRGMLDPLRIGPEDTREDLACNFLLSILPSPVAASWQTEIRLAVQSVSTAGGRSCGAVIDELERGSDDARAAARALSVHARSGLARLGMAEPNAQILEAGSQPITSIRISNLTLPLPGTPRAELLEDERVSRAILHLLAVYALRLTSHDPRRHSVLGFDEAWVLLSDTAGRALLDRISRLGRARNVTPLLATQVLGDVDALEGLIGAAFCFGVETEREARDALRLLHLDEDDETLQQRLTSFRRGRCFLRDYGGHVSPVQIDLLDPDLLAKLDTTPERDEAQAQLGGNADVLAASG